MKNYFISFSFLQKDNIYKDGVGSIYNFSFEKINSNNFPRFKREVDKYLFEKYAISRVVILNFIELK